MGDFVGFTVLTGSPIPQTEDGLKLYRELWNKVSWAIGSAYNRPYRGSTEIRSLARRMTLIVLANTDVILEKDRQPD